MTAEPAAAGELWTVRRVLNWTTQYLADHGSDAPRLEAEILLAHARGCSRIALYTHFDTPLSEEVRGRMRELVRRRANAEPVAYLVGHREFFSLDFEVNTSVFIPRPETELLVMEALAALKGNPASRVLDLCTGSGCVAIAIAVHARAADVTAVDASPAALQVACRNAVRHHVDDRILLLEGDLFAPLSDARPFEVIVSNPPYVARADEMSLPPDVRRHEPPEALFAGTGGLDVIGRIVDDAPAHLTPGGLLALEISPEQAEAVRARLDSRGTFCDITVIDDLARRPRLVSARRRS